MVRNRPGCRGGRRTGGRAQGRVRRPGGTRLLRAVRPPVLRRPAGGLQHARAAARPDPEHHGRHDRHQSAHPPGAPAGPYPLDAVRALRRTGRSRPRGGRLLGRHRALRRHPARSGRRRTGPGGGGRPRPVAVRRRGTRQPGRGVHPDLRTRSGSGSGAADLDGFRGAQVPRRHRPVGRRLDTGERGGLAQRPLPVLTAPHRRGRPRRRTRPRRHRHRLQPARAHHRLAGRRPRDPSGRWLGGSVDQWITELTEAVLEHGASGFVYFSSGDPSGQTGLGRWAEEIVPAVRAAVAKG